MRFRALLLTALSLASACTPSPAEPCGPEPLEEQAECPIAECARTCASVEEGLACCFEQGGYGLADRDLEELVAKCSGDSCDPRLYIDAETALCAAQVHGLASGVGWCGGYFQYGETPVWMIRNTTYDGCGTGTQDVRGEGMAVDAATGIVTGWYTSSSIVECR